MRIFIFTIIILHGLIHLMGFVKAFGFADISELNLAVSRSWGLLWMISALTLIIAGILWILNMENWWIAALIGLILSQILIFTFWQDARFGTIPNLIILSVLISGFLRHSPPEPITINESASFEERYGNNEGASRAEPRLFSPFELEIDPMERLLLINIENDPDSLYVGFEPQVFNDEINGTGMLVIGWRVDGKVDVYHQPGLTLDPDKYDIAGKGLAQMTERQMVGARFDITENGVKADITFTDLNGRIVELRIEERSNRARKPFGLLAPMGIAAENPSGMPLILLHDFYFVRRYNTEYTVKIDSRYHEPDKLPIPMDYSRMYFARYSPDLLILLLNPAFNGKLDPLSEPDGNTVIVGDTRYNLALNNNVHEISSISRTYNRHAVTMAFSPAFPNLDAYTGRSAEGVFEIAGHESTGVVRGDYTVQNIDGQILVELNPSGGWIPNEKKLSVRFLYRVVPMFRNWPTTYRWTAMLNKDENGVMQMNSSWERINMEGQTKN
jgi:hypothetical protein